MKTALEIISMGVLSLQWEGTVFLAIHLKFCFTRVLVPSTKEKTNDQKHHNRKNKEVTITGTKW